MSEWWTYRLSDFLLFSPQTYYRLFELYNAEIWPAHVLALAIALAILTLMMRGDGVRWSRVAGMLLAACWLWVAWASCSTDTLRSIGRRVVRRPVRGPGGPSGLAGATGGGIKSASRLHRAGAVALFVFALLIQPLIGPLTGRPWTQAEVFGMAPDLTALGTLGFALLQPTAGRRWLLLVIPLLWCAISGATLWTMGSPDALVLPAAGLLALRPGRVTALKRPCSEPLGRQLVNHCGRANIAKHREARLADLKKVLGTMLVSGLAGRTGGRGAALATAAPMLLGGGTNKAGMSLGKKAGLAALQYLAYKKAWNDSGNAPSNRRRRLRRRRPGASGPFGALFDALGVFQPKTEGAGAAAPAAAGMDDAQALLLIRAMIAAANADGQITPDERSRILQHLDKAGAGQEERRIVEQEIQSPRPLDDIIREVRDQDTAEQVYLASEISLRGGSATEQRYLDFLASRSIFRISAARNSTASPDRSTANLMSGEAPGNPAPLRCLYP